MILRATQVSAFEGAARDRFTSVLCERVSELAPELAMVAKEDGVRQFVTNCVERAHSHGLANSESLRFFVETSAALGHRFTTDPQYPWAAKALKRSGRASADEDERVHLLSLYVADYLDAVAGPANEYALAALERVVGLLPDRLDNLIVNDHAHGLDLIRRCYPQKFDYAGRDALNRLFTRAADEHAALGLIPGPSLAMIAILMVVFGHGVLDDPLYPWVGECFPLARQSGRKAQASHLYKRTRVYLSHMVKNLSTDDASGAKGRA